MKAVLLARVSSKDQQETGYSLPAQERFLKEYADRHHFEVEKVFSISESASGKRDREIFNSMMTLVKKQGIKIIICEKVDRLTRNFKDAVAIDDWLEKDEKSQVHLVKDSIVLHKNSKSQEKLNWGIRVLLAKNYIDNLSEEVRKGQKEKITQGWLPTKPPLGYRTIGEDGRKIHVIDEQKAPLVQKMFQLYASGAYTTKSLVEKMHKDGLRTQMGNKLVKSRLHDNLTNPFYYGKILWHGELYDGKHEPLISKETFDRVKAILNGKFIPKVKKHSYLFRGLMKCLGCDCAITWETQKGIVYGHCNHYRDCEKERWSRQDDVEVQLIEKFEALQIKNLRLMGWIRKALKDSHEDKITYHEKALEALNAKQQQILKRISKIYDDKIDGKISEEFYYSKLKEYKQEETAVIESIKKYSDVNFKYYDFGVNFYDLSQKSKEVFLRAEPEEKRRLIKLVFSSLVLDEGKLIAEYSKPFQLLANAVWATNSSRVEKFIETPGFTLEPIETPGLSTRYDNPGAVRPIWLPG